MSNIYETPQKKVSLSSNSNKNISFDDMPAADLLFLIVDVGQGESTIVVERLATKEGMKPSWVAIIDGGYPTAGRGAIARYLRALEIQQIDLMVCTHFDGDHTRGLTDFLAVHATAPKKEKVKRKIATSIEPSDPEEGFKVKTLLVRSDNEKDCKSQTKPDLLGIADIKVEEIVVAENWKGVKTDHTMVWCLAGSSASHTEDENLGSIALRFEHDSFSYYTAGDLPSLFEDKIKQKPLTAFKCGHHGSAGSTSEDFLASVQPRYAFISCGDQGFGHPTYAVMERLLSPKSTVEHVFLTNCIHNRQGANPKYEEAALTMKGRYEDELKTRWLKSLKDFKFGKKYDEAYAKDLGDVLEKYKELKKTGERGDREFGLYLNAAVFAAKHHVAQLDVKKKTVTVAGSESKPGTIVLRFTKGRCTVGCSCDGAWQWFGAKKADALEEALADVIDNAVVGKDGSVTTIADSPQKTVQNELTTAYTEHFLDRAEVYDKNRFSRITVSGLREKFKGAEYIPFCFDKECIREDSENDPLFHLECPRCMDEEIYVHADCYKKGLVPTLKLDKTLQLSADDGSMCEVVIEPKQCPNCQPHAEEYEKKKTTSRSDEMKEAPCEVCKNAKGIIEPLAARCPKCKKRVPAHASCWQRCKPKNAFRCLKCR